MRIAIVHPSLVQTGGAERVVVWLARELVARGHEATVITGEYDEFWGARASLPFELVELHVRVEEAGALQILDWVKAARRIAPRLREVDVINAHNYPAYVWVQWAKRRDRAITAPTVWYCEEPFHAFYAKVTQRTWLRAVALREAEQPVRPPAAGEQNERQSSRLRRLAGWARRETARWVGERIDRKVVPSIDLITANSRHTAALVSAIFGRPAEPCPLGVPVRPIEAASVTCGDYLLTVSRLMPQKNIGTAIKAVARLHAAGRLPFSRYVIAGEGPDQPYLRALIEEHGLAGVVDLRGFVSDAERDDLYRGAGAVLYLPLDEMFGLVFLEAAQFFKASIGPDADGPTEVVLHGRTGLLVDPLDVNAVAETIASAFSSPERLRQWGAAARERLAADYSFSGYVDRFLSTLERVRANGAFARAPSGTSRTDRQRRRPA